jgi:hypothetical protein
VTEQTIADTAMTTPASCGDATLPKRNGVKTLMPASSWLKRGVRLEYQAGGECRETKGSCTTSIRPAAWSTFAARGPSFVGTFSCSVSWSKARRENTPCQRRHPMPMRSW